MVSYKGGSWPLEGGHAAGAGQGECCCAQHDARHALHDHNLQHTADLYLYLYMYLCPYLHPPENDLLVFCYCH